MDAGVLLFTVDPHDYGIFENSHESDQPVKENESDIRYGFTRGAAYWKKGVMLTNTFERLRAMKMSAFADELEHQMKETENYSRLDFEDRLTLLIDSE